MWCDCTTARFWPSLKKSSTFTILTEVRLHGKEGIHTARTQHGAGCCRNLHSTALGAVGIYTARTQHGAGCCRNLHSTALGAVGIYTARRWVL